jgi:hypothetical protein
LEIHDVCRCRQSHGTSFQGKSVDGLRVEPIVPKPALKDGLNDQINF